MIVIAVGRQARFNLLDFPACQFIDVHVAPAVVHQKAAIPSPVGRFDDVVKLLQFGPDTRENINCFQDAERIALRDPLS